MRLLGWSKFSVLSISKDVLATGQWKREIRLESSKEAIRMIAPNIMFHLPSEQSSLSDRKLDEWGQVQPPNQGNLLKAIDNKIDERIGI